MPDYQKLYSNLFNGITDTIKQLQELQIRAEEDYLAMTEEKAKVFKFGKPEASSPSDDDEE